MGSTTARLPGVFETFGDVPPLPPPSHHYPDPRDARLADPRSAGSYGGSPNGVNGYHAPPPPGQQAQQGPPPPGAHQRAPPSYLPPPPMQPSADPRTQVPADYYSVAAGASYPGYYRGTAHCF